MAAHNSVFAFNDSIYMQIDGAAIPNEVTNKSSWMNAMLISNLFYIAVTQVTFFHFNNFSRVNPYVSYLIHNTPILNSPVKMNEVMSFLFLISLLLIVLTPSPICLPQGTTFTGIGVHISYILHI